MSRLGTGGNIGTEAAARVRPDGYTILMRSLSPNAVNVHLYSRLGFDPIKDFESIVYVSAVPNILVVAADSPIKTAKDLINAAKTAPGKLTYGTAGVSSSQHLAASLLGIVTGTTMTHVPYKGAGIAQQDYWLDISISCSIRRARLASSNRGACVHWPLLPRRVHLPCLMYPHSTKLELQTFIRQLGTDSWRLRVHR